MDKENTLTQSEAKEAFASLDYHTATASEVDKLLSQFNLDPNTPDNVGETPLIQALWAGNVEIAALLLDKGADMDARALCGHTPLMICVRKGLLDMMKLLVSKGSNIRQLSPCNRETLIATAVWAHQPTLVKWLADAGVDINTPDNLGWTPLMLAAFQGSENMAKLLLFLGADNSLRQQNGWTAEDIARFRNHPEVAALLARAQPRRP